MNQMKLVITVYNGDGEVIFSKDPAVPQDVNACINLFAEVGNEIDIAIREFEIPVKSQSK